MESSTRLRKTTYGGASRTMLSSSSKKNVTLATGSEKFQGPAKPPVQVLLAICNNLFFRCFCQPCSLRTVYRVHYRMSLRLKLSQVIDEGGNDVTPQPLIQLDPNTVRKNQSNILADSSAGTVCVLFYLFCLCDMKRSVSLYSRHKQITRFWILELA